MAISPDDQRGLGSFEPPLPAATPFPTADVQAKPQLGEVEYESLPVRRPEEDLKEVKIVVRASVLTRCRSKLRGAAEASFPWYELALAASTLAAGAVAGAIPADIKPGTSEDFIFESAGRPVFFRAIDPSLIPSQGALSQLAAIEDIVFIGHPHTEGAVRPSSSLR